jgi:hypothetical protein
MSCTEQQITSFVKARLAKGFSFQKIKSHAREEYGYTLSHDRFWKIYTDFISHLAGESVSPAEKTPASVPDVSEAARLKIEREYASKILDMARSSLKVPKLKEARLAKTSDGETVHIDIGDLHHGQLINAGDGTPIYSSRIAKDRLISSYLPAIIEFVAAGRDVKDVFFNLLGDIIDGEIVWAGQHGAIDQVTFFQLEDIIPILWTMIVTIAHQFPSLRAVNVRAIPGNHGRMSPKDKTIGQAKVNNWDNVVYHTLAFAASVYNKERKGKGVPILVDYATLEPLNYEAGGIRMHLRHYNPDGANAPSKKAYFAQQYLIHAYDMVHQGHWHKCEVHEFSGLTIIQNGALSERSEYAEKLGLTALPSQMLLATRPERPVSRLTRVDF